MPIGRESIRGSVRPASNGAPGTVPGMAELIPRRILFGNPDKGSPEVAPDGRRLAHLAPVDDVLNVWVGDIDGEGSRPVTSDTDRGIRSYRWAEDGRHLIYLQDSGGDENWRVHVVDPKTGHADLANPKLDKEPAYAGFSMRNGRLTWSAPADGGDQTVQVLAWKGDTFGRFEILSDGSTTVVR